MFHPDTQFLIDHWTGMAREPGVRGGIPDRAALEPSLLGRRLPRIMMVEGTGEAATVRLAGSWIEAFHGLRLTDQPVLAQWRAASQPLVAAAMLQTVREARPVIVAALAGSPHAMLDVVIAPFRGANGTPDRILMLYSPAVSLAMAVDEPRLLTARVSMGVGDPGRPALTLATVQGRRVA